MSVSTIPPKRRKKCRVIQVIKDAGFVIEIYYIAVLYCGSSHWRRSKLHFLTLTFKLIS